ncbi:hypothetical protein MVI27_02500 [Chryseobacterium salipaludis]|uniref:hypothetical protein n=1 Tax=Chryseobacterium TaxID=59732 RepID=UPI001FF52D0E|nr:MULTISPECIES: hypothetical protein [Chryseobacterium]MCJ8497123.1 hypothetical protein [Chryseobacterium salipaludis]MCX3296605.1 hypothetical protein [Planobacterium sp. JC490]
MGRGAEELSQNKTTQVNWSVLIISSLVITAFSVWAIITPGQASATMERVFRPALDEVAAEFRGQGYEAERRNADHDKTVSTIDSTRPSDQLLRVSTESGHDFYYQVAMIPTPTPTFSGKMALDHDVYYRLEVTTQTGSGGYDLMGLTKQQVIDDVLEQYEAYLTYVRELGEGGDLKT